MSKNVIDTERFGECLNEFMQIAKDGQEKGVPVSFRTGFIEEQEGYKRAIYADAKSSLKLLDYEKSGALCGWLMDSINSNNLFGWRNRIYLQEKFETFPAESENLLYRIYVEPSENDEVLFYDATQLFGKR